MDDIEEQYREQALTGLAHPQCKSTLQTLVESGDLSESLQERAETLSTIHQTIPEQALRCLLAAYISEFRIITRWVIR